MVSSKGKWQKGYIPNQTNSMCDQEKQQYKQQQTQQPTTKCEMLATPHENKQIPHVLFAPKDDSDASPQLP